MATKKLNAKAVILRAWKAIAGAETAIHDVTKLDLELTASKLKRGGSRKSKIPQEQLDLVLAIAAEEKQRQVHGYRKRVISRLKKEHGIDVGTEDNLKKSYLE